MMNHATKDGPIISAAPSAADGDDAAADDLPLFTGSVATADHGMRLDAWLAREQPQFSRSHWQRLIDAAQVQVDGRTVVSARQALQAGQAVQAVLEPPERDNAFAPEPVPISLVHEDEALLVIDKPAGLVVHPAAGNWQGTLLNGLLYRWPAQAALPRAGIVHRLDKDTSGLMVVARTPAAQWHLVQQLQAKTAGREYLALVQGQVAAAGRVDAPIGRDPKRRTRMAVTPGGKPAATRYTPLGQAQLLGRPVSLLRCALETGRTHQIRVHMAHIGHPLVGDALYGGSGFTRQALHAWQLRVQHPQSGATCTWRSPVPQDLRDLLERLQLEPALHALA